MPKAQRKEPHFISQTVLIGGVTAGAVLALARLIG
jgi:hypothetical protein